MSTTIDDLAAELGGLRGRTVLVRSDLNVPMEDGAITDDGRIHASVPTIERLAQQGARVVVMAHVGRPDGRPNVKYSLCPLARRMSDLLGQPVSFATDATATCSGEGGMIPPERDYSTKWCWLTSGEPGAGST